LEFSFKNLAFEHRKIKRGHTSGKTTVLVKATSLARIAPGKTLLYQLLVSALLLPFGSAAMNEPGIFKMTPIIAVCVVYQAVWIALITYLIWFWLVTEYPASRPASFTFLTPLFGVLSGATLLGEPITKALLLPLVLVGAGIYLVNRPDVRKKSLELSRQ
jgi:drug/metabolite transporter (DMT)-like permease